MDLVIALDVCGKVTLQARGCLIKQLNCVQDAVFQQGRQLLAGGGASERLDRIVNNQRGSGADIAAQVGVAVETANATIAINSVAAMRAIL